MATIALGEHPCPLPMLRALAIAIALAAPTARAQLVPPRLVSVPDVDAPPESADAAEVVIEVGADGTATLVECEHGEELCARITEALGQAVLEPATRDGAPIAGRIGLRIRLHRPPRAPVLEVPDSPYEDR